MTKRKVKPTTVCRSCHGKKKVPSITKGERTKIKCPSCHGTGKAK